AGGRHDRRLDPARGLAVPAPAALPLGRRAPGDSPGDHPPAQAGEVSRRLEPQDLPLSGRHPHLRRPGAGSRPARVAGPGRSRRRGPTPDERPEPCGGERREGPAAAGARPGSARLPPPVADARRRLLLQGDERQDGGRGRDASRAGFALPGKGDALSGRAARARAQVTPDGLPRPSIVEGMRMICAEVVQRLPWLLNGTLPPAEQGDVRDHLASCAACRAALAETRSAYRIFTAHVPAAALVDYAWGQVPERLDIGLIERHLEECPECAAELELIRTSRQLADEPQVALFERRTRPAPPAPRRAWQVSALAAALGGVVALTGWIHSDRQRNALEGQLGETRQTVAIMTSDLAGIRTQVEKLRQAGGGSTPETTTAPPAPVAPSGSAPAAAALLTGSAAHLSLLGASLGLTARGGPDDGALDAHAEMG